MAPQATTTAPATPTPPSTVGPSENSNSGSSSGGLSQNQIGAILGGIVGLVVVVLFLWYCITNSESYLFYHAYYVRRTPRHYYETEVSIDDDITTTESSSVSVTDTETGQSHTGYGATPPGRRGNQNQNRTRRGDPRVSRSATASVRAAARAARHASKANAAAADMAAQGNAYVFSEPLQMPQTARYSTDYRHSAYPQYPGVNRFPGPAQS